MTDKLTKRQSAIISAYTGILLGKFNYMHELAEEVFGRAVSTLEFSDEHFKKELKERVKDEFMEIQPEGTFEKN